MPAPGRPRHQLTPRGRSPLPPATIRRPPARRSRDPRGGFLLPGDCHVPATVTLPDLQRIATSLELAVAATASTLTSPQAQRRAFRAQAQLRGVILELGAAIVLETPPAPSGPIDELLLVEVISPGADRADELARTADELIRTIDSYVRAISDRAAALRLRVRYDAHGARLVGEVMRRNGWRQNDHGWWHRPGYGAAAGVASEQPR